MSKLPFPSVVLSVLTGGSGRLRALALVVPATAALLATGCGDKDDSCDCETGEVCPDTDGSGDGTDGSDGADGTDGTDGTDGGDGTDGSDGGDGTDGSDGDDGPAPTPATAALEGLQPGDLTGWSMDQGDLNGDGELDLVFGVRGAGGEAGPGAACVLYGPVDPATVDLADAVCIDGVEADGRVGLAVKVVPDLNDDDRDDLLVGANQIDAGTTVNAGAVFLFDGAAVDAGPPLTTDAALTLTGPNAYGWLGAGLAVVGDHTGDTVAEVLLGASADREAVVRGGGAFLVDGNLLADALAAPAGEVAAEDIAVARILGESEDDYLGAVLSGPGDLDGDGQDDLLIGNNQQDPGAYSAGRAYLLAGPVSGTLSAGDSEGVLDGISGSATADGRGDELGRAVAPAGDVDGDGRNDVWIGAPGTNSSALRGGRVHLVLGTADLMDLSGPIDDHTALRIDGDRGEEGLGRALVGDVDIDGDGTLDLVISGGGSPELDGVVLAFLLDGAMGTLTSSDAAWRSVGGAEGAELGVSLAVLPGFFGTDEAVLAAGAPREPEAGAVHLFELLP